MPTNNLNQPDIATHQTNIWNKVSSTAKQTFHYKISLVKHSLQPVTLCKLIRVRTIEQDQQIVKIFLYFTLTLK
jgi:hypothetical protein